MEDDIDIELTVVSSLSMNVVKSRLNNGKAKYLGREPCNDELIMGIQYLLDG